MNELCCFVSVIVMGKKILVVGGMGDYCILLFNCELYDLIINIWILFLMELNVLCLEVVIVRIKKKIFVFGGIFSRGIVECYDELREEWEEIGCILSILDFIYVCVIWFLKMLVMLIKGGRLFCV